MLPRILTKKRQLKGLRSSKLPFADHRPHAITDDHVVQVFVI